VTPVRSSASEMFSKTASEKERLDMEGMFHNSVVVCCPNPTHFCGPGITNCWHKRIMFESQWDVHGLYIYRE
jgi:hypothetical protein